jgi:transcriptional regulator with XRE-family HTH domain
MTKPKLNTGAAKLRIWLVKHKVTQGEFAERVGVGRSTLMGYVVCNSVPPLSTATKIEEQTGVLTRDWLTPYTGALSKVPTFRRGRRSNAEVLREELSK